MTTLIITEKPNVAERIARAIGTPEKLSRDGVRYYRIHDAYVAPAVGHIFTLNEKAKGVWHYPVFNIEWVPSYKVNKSSEFTKKYLDNIHSLAKECDSFINACDYDTEGEVIGYNVIRYACDTSPESDRVKRMKYSTLTNSAIVQAYRNLEPVNQGMADAGLTRHVLDWYWGINLSRALTLAIRKARGYTTLSIGRVQGPMLKILADRDREIERFQAKPYWELEMSVRKEKELFLSLHEKGKFWEETKAREIEDRCEKTAIVKSITKSQQKLAPPYPFDLTTLQIEAYRHLNISPRRTLEIAQQLYTNALISYPRTSSQQIPKDINCRAIIQKLQKIQNYQEMARELLSKKRLFPHNGRKKDPAHPAIYPTGEIPGGMSQEGGKIYDLICRRFFATFGDESIRESVKVKLENNGEVFLAGGIRTLEPGWQALYGPYAKFKEEELPELKENEVLDVEKIGLSRKETQPPKRYTPASIIQKMEKSNLGTKATRSQILDVLFKRKYLEERNIKVTPLGLQVADTLDKYCPEILSEKLTRKFERETESIEQGKTEKDKVIEEGQRTIEKLCLEFKENEGKIGEELARSLRKNTAESLGKCPKCEGFLVLRKSRFGGYFVGCGNYPKCKFTMSLPQGRVSISGDCKKCESKILLVKGKNVWRFCVNPECPSKKK